jgi:hypothetical protein
VTEKATVTYEASCQRFDGGWDKIIITVPNGASDGEIAAAIATWQRIREQALPALKDTNPPLSEANGTPDQTQPSVDLVITFGKKHPGRTIREILAIDPGFVEWLAESARTEIVRTSARMALGQRDAANGSAPAEDAPEEEIPF